MLRNMYTQQIIRQRFFRYLW